MIAGSSQAAAMPAMAAAGLVWKAKELLSNETETPSLASQPSIINWHDMPVSQE